MNVSCIAHCELQNRLTNQPTASLDFVLLVTGALDKDALFLYLKESVRVLKDGGVLFVQGLPGVLPELGAFLDRRLTFKYWIAVESAPVKRTRLPSVHGAVLLFTKGKGKVNIRRTRLPHQQCTACGRTLKDWGGKTHLMNPEGYVISDVIKDLPSANNYTQISRSLYSLLTRMLDTPSQETRGMVGPREGLLWLDRVPTKLKEEHSLPLVSKRRPPLQASPTFVTDVVYQGDVLEVLKRYPDASMDLVFADPPYNLDKDYALYDDARIEHEYIEWCNAWLAEYVRILKPTGSLFVLNLPRWGMHHATFLNQHLCFQSWIVWDAMSKPRGKLMPAHYALLFYTKHPSEFTFNYEKVSPVDAYHYCLRTSCIRKRKEAGDDDKVNLSDIWRDIHRIFHRHDRDSHPCQLPEALMGRIIKLTTNPGDVVLDAFGGTGTTPVVASKLGRRYIAIDLDPLYVQIMKDKVARTRT